MQSNTRLEVENISVSLLTKRCFALKDRLRPFIYDDDGRPFPCPAVKRDDVIDVMGDEFSVEQSLPAAQARRFPVLLLPNGPHTVDAFVRAASDLLGGIETKVHEWETARSEFRRRCHAAAKELEIAIRALIVTGEDALFGGGDQIERMTRRLAVVSRMKCVGEHADAVKALAERGGRVALGRVMRHLIDTLYLQLTQPVVERAQWDAACVHAKSHVESLLAATEA